MDAGLIKTVISRNLKSVPIQSIFNCMTNEEIKEFFLEYTYYNIAYTRLYDITIEDDKKNVSAKVFENEEAKVAEGEDDYNMRDENGNLIEEMTVGVPDREVIEGEDVVEDVVTDNVGREFVEFDNYTPLGMARTYVPKAQEYDWMRKMINNYDIERRLGKKQPSIADNDYRFVMKRINDIPQDVLLAGEYNSSLIVNTYRDIKNKLKIYKKSSRVNEYEKDAILFLATKFHTYRTFRYLIDFFLKDRDEDYKYSFFEALNFVISRYFDNRFESLRLFISSPPCITNTRQLVNILEFLKKDNQLDFIDLKSYLYIIARKCNNNLKAIVDFYNVKYLLNDREYLNFTRALNTDALWDMDFEVQKEFVEKSRNQLEYVSEKLKKTIFPTPKNRVRGIDFERLMLTTESLYSVSKNNASTLLVKILKSFFRTNNITITDATANVGSDTIALALTFRKVNAIELDETNFYALRNNVMDVYRLGPKVKLFRGNSIEILPKLKQKVIYVDAPWGGKGYRQKRLLKLFLGDYEISDVCNMFKDKCRLFVFKVPVNYDFDNFKQVTKVEDNVSAMKIKYRDPKTRRTKFIFYLIDTDRMK